MKLHALFLTCEHCNLQGCFDHYVDTFVRLIRYVRIMEHTPELFHVTSGAVTPNPHTSKYKFVVIL